MLNVVKWEHLLSKLVPRAILEKLPWHQMISRDVSMLFDLSIVKLIYALLI